EIASPEVSAAPADPAPGEDRASASELPISARNQEVAAQTADETSASARSTPAIDGAGPKPRVAFLPSLELSGSAQSWRESPAAQAAAAASREAAARLFLPELELRAPRDAQPAELLPAQVAVAPMPQPP